MITAWWFGTFGLFFHILGVSSSQLTNSIICQRGRYTTRERESDFFEFCFPLPSLYFVRIRSRFNGGQPKKKLRYILAGTMLLSSIIMLTKSLGRRMLSDIFFLVFSFVGALGFGLLGFASQVYVAGENWAATWRLNTLLGPAKRKIFRYPRG